MKKAISVFLGLFVLLCSLSVTCFAAENNVQDVTVNAKYHNSDIEIHSVIVDDGIAELSPEDNTLFYFEFNEIYNEYTLVIHQITIKDKDAFDWFKSFVSNGTSDFRAYEIYLLNAKKEKLKLPNNTEIQLTISDTNYLINGISCDGESFEITSSIKGNSLQFNSIEKADYYLFQKRKINDNSEISIKPNNDTIPTGDFTDYYCWLILSLLSLTIIICCVKKHEEFFNG